MSEKDFDKLVAAWLDGRLSEQDSLALQTELRSSASARAKFRKYTQLDVALHEFADTSGLLTPEQLIASALGGSNAEQGQVALASAGSARKNTNWLGWFPVLSVGIAATMLLGVTYLYNRDSSDVRPGNADQSETVASAGSEGDSQDSDKPSERSVIRPPAPVATLAAAKEAVWKDSQLEIGQALYESETVNLTSGDARISVGFGAEIVAEAPCSLTFLANDRVRLNHGEVAVDVASWAKGFTIVTEEMDIVDLGTTFTVSASPGVRSETTVLKGLVRVHPTKSQEKQRRGLLVTEGHQVSVDGNGLLKNGTEEAAQQRLADLDFGVSQPYRPVKLNNTGLGLAVGDEDQHWRVVAGPEGAFQGEEFATVCVPHERYLENDPSASQWVSIADWTTAPANSVYTFQTEFDLEGYDLSTMQLFGRFLADNGIAAVRVNGQSVKVQSWVDNIKYQPFGDTQFRFVNVTEGLVKGRNTIEVDVRNGMQRAWKHGAAVLSPIPNPMALRVEWYAFGRQHDFDDAALGTEPFDAAAMRAFSLARGLSRH